MKTFFFIRSVAVAALLLPVVAFAEKMVVIDLSGRKLDVSSEKVKALAKEKLRITEVKKRVLAEELRPEEMVKLLFEPLVEPNKKQYEQNVRNANKFKSMAEQAVTKNQPENAKKYMKVARLFYEYSQCNKTIVMAFNKGASGDIDAACEDILKIEKQIQMISKKDVPRDWFTLQEVKKIAVIPEKQYEKMRRDEEKKAREENNDREEQGGNAENSRTSRE